MTFPDGKGEGLCEAWHPDGKLKSKVTLKNGDPIQTDHFTSNAS